MDEEYVITRDSWDDKEIDSRNMVPVHSPYLHPQRKMQHKIRIFFDELRDFSIKQDCECDTPACESKCTNLSGSARSRRPELFNGDSRNRNENGEIPDTNFRDIENLIKDATNSGVNSPNDNNVTHFYQLFSSANFRHSAAQKPLILDGNSLFNLNPKVLSKNEGSQTEQPVGWMSDDMCDDEGYFRKPVRLVYTFRHEQSIARWLIRAHKAEAPYDFSVCVYNANDRLIRKRVFTGNRDSDFVIDIDRGLCKKIELRITRWCANVTTAQPVFAEANAKIMYFYHNAIFPEGATDYYSSDLLQSFSVNEHASSSIGKANYGVQSDSGQFSLVNIDRYFHSLKFADFLEAGLKVQFFVNAQDDFDIGGDYVGGDEPDGERDKEMTRLAKEGHPDDGWTLIATQYISDIEFDEVKHVVRFKTQDRLLDLTNHKYGGLKTVIPIPDHGEGEPRTRLDDVRSREIVEDIMGKAELRLIQDIIAENGEEVESIGQPPDVPSEYQDFSREPTVRDSIEKCSLYEVTSEARKILGDYNSEDGTRINKGLINEMSIWAALQKVCNIDLLHAYISRDDVLIIDKINQF